MLLDNAVHLCQSQTAAFAGILGGEERLKDVRQHVWGNAGSGVGDGEDDPVAGRELGQHGRGFGPHVALLQRNREHAAIWHGIAGVDRQVGEELLDAGGIGVDGDLLLRANQQDADVFRQNAFQQFDVFFGEGGQIHRMLFDDDLPSEIENLLDQFGGAVGLLHDGVEPFSIVRG